MPMQCHQLIQLPISIPISEGYAYAMFSTNSVANLNPNFRRSQVRLVLLQQPPVRIVLTVPSAIRRRLQFSRVISAIRSTAQLGG